MTRETVDFEGPRLRSSEGGPGPGRRAAGSDENHRFVAPGGSRYAKDLLADIMLYRNLRLRVLRRGGEAKTETLRAFRALDGDLRYAPPGQTDSSERREFTRFSCHIPGTLRFERGAETRHDVRMVDVAVDGARIRCSTVPAETTGLVYLSLPTVGPAGLRCIVFTARVAWVRGTELGLVFAGAPSWATRNKERAEDDTLRRPIPPLHLEEKDSE
jgi:hypothetical protein